MSVGGLHYYITMAKLPHNQLKIFYMPFDINNTFDIPTKLDFSVEFEPQRSTIRSTSSMVTLVSTSVS